jgi:hypothetical protein
MPKLSPNPVTNQVTQALNETNTTPQPTTPQPINNTTVQLSPNPVTNQVTQALAGGKKN